MISPPLFFLCIFGIHHTLSYEKDGKEEWHNPDNTGIPMPQGSSSLFLLFLTSFVVDDLHMLSSNEGHTIFLGPIYTSFKHQGQEYPGYI